MNTIIPNIEISAISSYLPEQVIDLTSFKDIYGEKEVNNIIRTTGIKHVRISAEGQTASDMCFEAAKDVIKNENIDIDEIDGLVFVSQTPDYLLPATSIILQDRLGLSKDTMCLDVHYGCSGYIHGIFQAASWIHTGACKKVLVLAGDTTTKVINPKDKALRMVFGDAGTATVVSVGGSSMGFSIKSMGKGHDKLIIPAGGARMPKTEQTRISHKDEDNNERSKEDLFMDGMAIFHFAISNVPKNIQSLIDLMNWSKDEVELFALHQANDFMVNFLAKKMKVDLTKVPKNSTNYGNTGPSTIPLLLSDLYSEGDHNLSKTVLSGFGVGLSWGSIGCSLSNTRFYKPINK